MTNLVTSQVVVETLGTTTPSLRTSQVVVEVLQRSSAPQLALSKLAAYGVTGVIDRQSVAKLAGYGITGVPDRQSVSKLAAYAVVGDPDCQNVAKLLAYVISAPTYYGPGAVINDRDRLLQATSPRFAGATANALLLGATTPLFHVAVGGAASPTSIVVTATFMGALTGAVTFASTNGATLTSVTDTSATLTYANMVGASDTITGTLVFEGVIYTAHMTVAVINDGATGGTGTGSRVCYSLTTLASLATTPSTITTTGGATFPANDSWGTGTVWSGSPSVPVAGQALYRSDATFDGTATVWHAPYVVSLKVGQLSVITADVGSITAGDLYAVTIHGGAGYPTNAYAFPTGSVNGGFHLSASGLLIGNANANRYFEVDANGDVNAPGFSIVGGNATFAGSLGAAVGTFAGTLTAAAINAVDTINIAGSAITANVFASGSGASLAASGTVHAASGVIVMPASNSGVIVIANVSMSSSSNTGMYYHVERNGTQVGPTQGASVQGGYVQTISFAVYDTPGAGTFTYELVCVNAASGVAGPAAVIVGTNNLVIMGAKR